MEIETVQNNFIFKFQISVSSFGEILPVTKMLTTTLYDLCHWFSKDLKNVAHVVIIDMKMQKKW
jgi:hypothetical protein